MESSNNLDSIRDWSHPWTRLALLGLGVWLTFFPPERLAHHVLPRIGGVLALASGVLGPHLVGVFNTAVILTVVYAVALGPMRLIGALVGDDALGRKLGDRSFWKAKPAPRPDTDERTRLHFQF